MTVSAADDDDIEVDAEIALTHTVRGGDYDSLAADSVTVTVPGFEVDEMAMAVTFMIPPSGVVTVPQGGAPVPAGTQVTLPTDVDAATLTLTAVEGSRLANPPRGFNAGDVAVDIELDGGASTLGGGSATVCLPVAEGRPGSVCIATTRVVGGVGAARGALGGLARGDGVRGDGAVLAVRARHGAER